MRPARISLLALIALGSLSLTASHAHAAGNGQVFFYNPNLVGNILNPDYSSCGDPMYDFFCWNAPSNWVIGAPYSAATYGTGIPSNLPLVQRSLGSYNYTWSDDYGTYSHTSQFNGMFPANYVVRQDYATAGSGDSSYSYVQYSVVEPTPDVTSTLLQTHLFDAPGALAGYAAVLDNTTYVAGSTVTLAYGGSTNVSGNDWGGFLVNNNITGGFGMVHSALCFFLGCDHAPYVGMIVTLPPGVVDNAHHTNSFYDYYPGGFSENPPTTFTAPGPGTYFVYVQGCYGSDLSTGDRSGCLPALPIRFDVTPATPPTVNVHF